MRAAVSWPTCAENRDGSGERIWKQRQTVSVGSPDAVTATQTLMMSIRNACVRGSRSLWYARFMLQPTPEHLLTDSEGRPYFLWDCEMTVEELRAGLLDPDRRVRAYLAGKVMRQAKPDDVFNLR